MSTILVVEDDSRIQKALHRLFTAEGYEVKCAGDGSAGLEMFQAGSLGAVVLDLMLPGLSGRELCKTMKRAAPDTPVIILSAVSEVADKVLLLELGADDYVTKPFSPRELLARVQAAMRRSKTITAHPRLIVRRHFRRFHKDAGKPRRQADCHDRARIQAAALLP